MEKKILWVLIVARIMRKIMIEFTILVRDVRNFRSNASDYDMNGALDNGKVVHFRNQNIGF